MYLSKASFHLGQNSFTCEFAHTPPLNYPFITVVDSFWDEPHLLVFTPLCNPLPSSGGPSDLLLRNTVYPWTTWVWTAQDTDTWILFKQTCRSKIRYLWDEKSTYKECQLFKYVASAGSTAELKYACTDWGKHRDAGTNALRIPRDNCRIWQRQWVILRLGYIRLILSCSLTLTLSLSGALLTCWFWWSQLPCVSCLMGKCKWQGTKGGLWPTPFEEWCQQPCEWAWLWIIPPSSLEGTTVLALQWPVRNLEPRNPAKPHPDFWPVETGR